MSMLHLAGMVPSVELAVTLRKFVASVLEEAHASGCAIAGSSVDRWAQCGGVSQPPRALPVPARHIH
eukprot:4574192-Amphidinium_carterae.6